MTHAALPVQPLQPPRLQLTGLLGLDPIGPVASVSQQPLMECVDASATFTTSESIGLLPISTQASISSEPLSNPSTSASYHSYCHDIERMARKQVADSVNQSKPAKKERKERTCQKCDISKCGGRQRVENCPNPCKDCQKVTCKGRNPKRPDRVCGEAWD